MGSALAAGLRKFRSLCVSAMTRICQLQLDVYGEVMDALSPGQAWRTWRATELGWDLQIAMLREA